VTDYEKVVAILYLFGFYGWYKQVEYGEYRFMLSVTQPYGYQNQSAKFSSTRLQKPAENRPTQLTPATLSSEYQALKFSGAVKEVWDIRLVRLAIAAAIAVGGYGWMNVSTSSEEARTALSSITAISGDVVDLQSDKLINVVSTFQTSASTNDVQSQAYQTALANLDKATKANSPEAHQFHAMVREFIYARKFVNSIPELKQFYLDYMSALKPFFENEQAYNAAIKDGQEEFADAEHEEGIGLNQNLMAFAVMLGGGLWFGTEAYRGVRGK
jgi:hypothetical protein